MIQDRFVRGHGGKKIPIPYVPVDQVGAEERAAFFTKRSIKKSSKLDALYTIISMIDLTTLEGADTPGKVKQMCSKARFPVPPGIYDSYKMGFGEPVLMSAEHGLGLGDLHDRIIEESKKEFLDLKENSENIVINEMYKAKLAKFQI